jgi:DNA-binding NarL/FixJ family response regulator
MNPTEPFTKQEKQILERLAKGQTNCQIATQLFISTHTVKNHKANMKRKLNIAHTCELMLFAAEYVRNIQKDTNGGGGVIFSLSST